jgi:uncharacterized protein (DUF1501 family)
MSSTRRNFLKSSLGAATLFSLHPVVPAFLSGAAHAAVTQKQNSDKVIVVLQLSGGNDGLNTVVPYADDEYARGRTTLRLTSTDVHKIDSYLGFHPEMKAFSQLYQDGLLSIIQGVGYPNSNRNHAVAIRDWHTGRPHQASCQTGWIGRTIDHACQRDSVDLPGVLVGNISPPLAINAENAIVPSIRSIDELTLHSSHDLYQPLSVKDSISNSKTDNPMLDFLQQRTVCAFNKNKKIEGITQSQKMNVEYPPFQLAQSLRTVAQLIRADVGIKMYYTELGGDGFGGFDNHANQRDNHAALLRQLSESVSAFVNDLKFDNILDNVLLITFSEFGRTVKENGRRGTGHGVAAPMLLAGGNITGGIIGSHPSLTDLDNDALKFHTDFRQVYATILDKWLGLDSKVIFGEKYQPLNILKV